MFQRQDLMSSVACRPLATRSWVLDGLVVAFVIVTDTSEALARLDTDARWRITLSVLLTVAASAPLIVRRFAPIPVLLAVTILGLASSFLSDVSEIATLGMFVATYSAVAWSPRPLGRIVVAPMLALVSAITVAALQSTEAIAPLVLLFLAAILGEIASRIRTGHLAKARELEALKTRNIERDREVVAAERRRIARELHDVVSHAISVITVQASAGQALIDSDPSRARAALESIETTSRDALTQMRHMLGALRSEDDDSPEVLPQPGLDQLAVLIHQAEQAGLRAELQVTGNVRDIPTATALSAFRIAQESTTNVIKHAAATSLWISVEYLQDALILEVADDGTGIPLDSERGAGHGLVGMNERVDLLSGELRVETRPQGGTLVRVQLPIENTKEQQ